MKLQLFLALALVVVLVLAVGGWTVDGVRWTLGRAKPA
jgi:hypothetical protein